MTELRFWVGSLKSDGSFRIPFWDPVLRIGAAFGIEVDGRTVLRVDDFPVVELAIDLANWLDDGARARFSFDPTEYDSDGHLVFESRGEDTMVVSGLDVPEFVASRVNVLGAANAFVAGVVAKLPSLGVDWGQLRADEPLIDPRRPRRT